MPTVPKAFSKLTTLLKLVPFWFNLLICLSILCLLAPLQQDMSHLTISRTDLAIGFLLQLPLLLLAVGLEGLLRALLSPLAFQRSLQLFVRIALAYLFVLYYAASTIIYAALGVFVSYEVIKIFFLDIGHIGSIMITSAGTPLLLSLVLLSALILASKKLATRFPAIFVQTPIKLFYIYCVCFVAAFAYSLIEKNNNENFSTNVFKNSFPPSFLLGQTLDSLSENKQHSPSLSTATLNPQITLAQYQQQAGELHEKPPVIFIMLESITYDHLGFTGYHRKDITPNLDKLFAQSVFFDRTYTPSNHSNLSQGSILSSQYSLRRIRLETFKEINYVKPMLFDILHAYGYETAIYSAQDENWLGMRRFIESHDAKIDHFKHAPDFNQYYQFYDGKIDDADLIAETKQYLSNKRDVNKPPFLYINLQRTHFDYRLKPKQLGEYGEVDSPLTGTFFNYGQHQTDKALLLYDNALHYVDQQLGVLFESLKEQGLYDEALIIVSADHGEAFYENGYPTHATSMFDAQIRTFTSIKSPKQTTGTYRRDAISSVDIMPMALEALGLKNHPAFQGFQLLKKVRSDTQPIFSTGQSLIRADTAISFPWKFYISEKEGAVLFNLQKDPKEKKNVNFSNPDQAEIMRQHLLKYRQYQTDYYMNAEQSVRDNYYAPQYQ